MTHIFITTKLALEAMLNKHFDIKSQKGVTLIEYSLLAGLIAVAAVSTLTTVGTDVKALFTAIAGKIPTTIP
jgi:pilus assembly protein Flp/PilA